MQHLETLSEIMDQSARNLAAAIKLQYPAGSIIRARINANGATVDVRVIGHSTSLRYPDEMHTENVKTGKRRNVFARPDHWHRVVIVSLPANSPNE